MQKQEFRLTMTHFRHILPVTWNGSPTNLRCPKIVAEAVKQYDETGFRKEGDNWRLTFEWSAIQPQRRRVVRPVLVVQSITSCELLFRAEVYADEFPTPDVLLANLKISTRSKSIEFKELIPDYQQRGA